LYFHNKNAVVAALLLGMALYAVIAETQQNKNVEALSRVGAAMDKYSELDFDTAKAFLEQAMTLAPDLDKKTLARIHLSFGVLWSGGFADHEKARRHFLIAVCFDPGILIDPLFLTPEIDAEFSSAKVQANPGTCQEATSFKSELAEAHFTNGTRLFEAKNYIEAAEAFKSAYQIAPHPTVLVNVGLCYERAGDNVRAIEAYSSVLEDLHIDKSEAAGIRARIDALKNKVGRIVIECPVETCSVLVDGMKAGRAPLAVNVAPGSHAVEGLLASGAVVQNIIDVTAGQEISVSIQSETSALHTGPSPPNVVPANVVLATDDGKRSALLRTPFWVATGVAVVGIAGIVAFGVRTSQLKDDYEKSERLDDSIRNDGLQSRMLTNVSIVISAVGAAAASAFLISDLATLKKRRARLAVVPFFGSGVGLVVAKEFP
jgi:tetratricopeptide (TPR) repeat protein